MSSNLVDERATFVTHLECSETGERHEADRIQGLSAAAKPLLVRYDLESLAEVFDRELLAPRPQDMWRFRELLPVRQVRHIVSLGEQTTPLVPLRNIGVRLGEAELVVKAPSGATRRGSAGMIVSPLKGLCCPPPPYSRGSRRGLTQYRPWRGLHG